MQASYDLSGGASEVCRMALIAKAIMEPTSETVAGRVSALVVLADFPDFVWGHLGQGNSRILSSPKT